MRRRHRVLGLLLLPWLLLGCQRSLFADNSPRTQFEMFDGMRQRAVPTEEPDVFGNPRPALRARLGRSR